MLRSLVLATILAMPYRLDAQAGAEGPFATAKGAFVALSVRDLQSTVKWYSEKLGLKQVMTIPRMDKIAGGAALEGDGILVELIQREDSHARTGGAELTHGIFKVGIIVTDFDRAVAAIRAKGIPIYMGPFPARADQRANVIIKDNEGNNLQIFGPYAR